MNMDLKEETSTLGAAAASNQYIINVKCATCSAEFKKKVLCDSCLELEILVAEKEVYKKLFLEECEKVRILEAERDEKMLLQLLDATDRNR